MITAKVGEIGYPLFGPYIDLPAGKYTAQFRLWADGISPISCGHVDVCRDAGHTIVAKKKFSPLTIKSNSGVLDLEFDVTAPGTFEFRVVSNGRSEFRVGDRSLKMEKDYLGMVGVEDRPVVLDEFFLKAAPHFRHIAKFGGRLSTIHDKPIVTFNGINMRIENEEDFQVLSEVHIFNEYNFETSERCCVIDIGMNVGFATLYFANMENVSHVHSFEPFGAPYRRAIDNIDINPNLAGKITAYNIGLAAKTETKSVSYDEAFTISTSTEGNGGSSTTTISLKNASAALADIIKSAKAEKLAVVIKMDCEGSEFEIFDDLAASDLLSDVYVLMVEWHKWWSADKTDKDLIKHLLQRGFVAFNKSHLSNPHAGMIYASKPKTRVIA